ncbi:MAG: hypothetical protein VX498_15765 [Myxococcota bacterium]|nr:hypothetical protein [Myxococcota bacterium]
MPVLLSKSLRSCLFFLLVVLGACSSPSGTGPQTAGPQDKPNEEVARTQGENPVGAAWEPEGSVVLDQDRLAVSSTVGAARCCAEAEVEHEGSPLRVYIAPLDEAALEGYVLFLGGEDRVVLMAQGEKQGVYDKLIYRSVEPAPRAEGRVTLSIDQGLLPDRDLKLWSGIDGSVSVGDVVLPGRTPPPPKGDGDPNRPMPDGEIGQRDKNPIPLGAPGKRKVGWGETVPSGIAYILIKRPGSSIPIPPIEPPEVEGTAPDGGK